MRVTLQSFLCRLPGVEECRQGDEGYDMNEARELFLARVAAEGRHVVIPKPNELQIDIDTEQHFENFVCAAEAFARNWDEFRDTWIEIHESKSGMPRWHITLTLPFDIDDPWKRIALQACFGSDPIRELLSATRLYQGDIHPTLFVETEPRSDEFSTESFDDLLDAL